jgi:Hint domain
LNPALVSPIPGLGPPRANFIRQLSPPAASTVANRNVWWVKDALPVRIARSALAPNVPHTDLYVTRGHSLLIDGVLVPAEVLINGTTITRYEAREYDELEFFHIKLESHDVVYAERMLSMSTEPGPQICTE